MNHVPDQKVVEFIEMIRERNEIPRTVCSRCDYPIFWSDEVFMEDDDHYCKSCWEEINPEEDP